MREKRHSFVELATEVHLAKTAEDEIQGEAYVYISGSQSLERVSWYEDVTCVN